MQYEQLDIPHYAPRAAPAAFHRNRSRAADSSQRRMLVIGAAAAGALLLLAGGWSIFASSRGPVPVVQADSRPFRVKPETRGGLQLSGSNDDILSGDVAKTGDALAVGTEAPQMEQLRELQQAEQTRSQAAAASLLAPPRVPPETTADASAKPAPASAPNSASASASAPTWASAPIPASPSTSSSAPPPPSASASASAPMPAATATATTPARVAKAAEPSRATGHVAVQLAAVATEDAARQFWRRLSARMPDLLGRRTPDLIRITRDNRVFWRVRVGGFADEAAAASFCEQVHAKSGGCSLAAF